MKRIWKIYHDEIPEFLKEFMELEIMKRIQKVGMNCGCEYTSFPQFQNLLEYSRYTHSVGCALIIWHFTKDMKQTLSGLFHDVSTPSFSHVIDFLHHDHLTQESTEEKTVQMMQDSDELMKLLEKYEIQLSDICDYHVYPIADNDTPKLSSDRLEYTLSNLYNYQYCTLEQLKVFYDDLVVAYNKNHEIELSFQHEEIACKFALSAMKMARIYVADADRFSMQVLSDILEKAVSMNVLKEEDLYQDEEIVISRLLSDDRTALMWKQFKSLKDVKRAVNKPERGLWRVVDAKKRWINPQLTSTLRVSEYSGEFQKESEEFLKQDFNIWIGTNDEISYL
ncbi:MAG: hypothetical protein IJ356_00350 [Erysipelotrichaceae bacterium]|nr:hypothetical protein [Erysipelotrichaceae bacterium]